jgi:uncharacterized protein (DUF4415 family)
MKKGNSRPLPIRLARQLRTLESMPDSAIDTRDMPAVRDWSDAERGRFYRPVKRQLTLRLDEDVIAFFKRQGEGYQTRMNDALREHAIAHEKPQRR